MDFIETLKKGDKEEIKRLIENEQFEYYANDCKTMKIDLGFAIPNYDILMEAIECNDSGEAVISESFGDELYFKMLTIYKTGISGAYFTRIEEYGPADRDAMQCSIIVTDDIDEEVKSIIEEYKKKSIIKLKDRTQKNLEEEKER
jgi:hypothetical protein